MPSQLTVLVGTHCTLTANLVDKDDVAIEAAGLTALRWTLFELDSGSQNAIAGIDDTALTPVSNYVLTGGILTMPLTSAHNVINNTNAASERHRALFKWTQTGGKINYGFIDFVVETVLKP